MTPSRLVISFAAFVTTALIPVTQAETVKLGKHQVQADRVLARFLDPQDIGESPADLRQLGWRVRRSYPIVPGLVSLESLPQPHPALATLPTGKGPHKRLLERIARLRATGHFAYVEPDYCVHALLEPNDARYTDGTLWGLRNTGALGGVAGADINAAAAWDLTTGSTNVIVAVIDSGIRYTHNDLAAQIWRNPGESGGGKENNGADDDGDGYVDDVFGINSITSSGDPLDDNDHGTHVAGTIGAGANNSQPHVGVAWNVRLMGCKFLDAQGSGTTSDAIECINFAVSKGARVLNNSWGGGSFSQSLVDAITAARNLGALFVASAGNDANNNDLAPSYPASYAIDNVVAVAAVDRADQLADFSNTGLNSVHVGAPGVDIFSSVSSRDNAYDSFSGTSMAAPHVSGVAALVLARFPGISLNELRQRILLSTVAVPALQNRTRTGGRINAFNALTIAADGVLEVSITTPTGTLVTGGSSTPVFVQVTDLSPVTNATASGTVSGGASLSFVNNGVGPDTTANDNVYSATLNVPSSGTTLALSVVVSAPAKQTNTNSVAFSILTPPPNDAFANRTVIHPGISSVLGSNLNATRETNEPDPTGVGGGKTVWWSWAAPTSGNVTMSTSGSSFDTILAVFTGTSLTALTEVGSNDDAYVGTFTSQVLFRATAGTIYQIALDGFSDDTGAIQLNLTVNEPVTNDNFASRAPIMGYTVAVPGSNFGATREAGEPLHAGQSGSGSVWWTWTAPTSGSVTLSTAGSTFDTLLGVYTGSAFGGLAEVASNDDVLVGAFQTSEVRFNAQQGVSYQIAVDGYGDSESVGNIILSLVTAAANDQFANRIPLGGSYVESSGFNLAATKQTGEPNHTPSGGGKSVWWSWTAPANGNATVTTAGSTFDTVLAVYTGSVVTALVPVASNDDAQGGLSRHSQVTFAAVLNATYQIAVDGYEAENLLGEKATDSGLVTLSIALNGASRLSEPMRLADGSFRFTLDGEPNKPYVIQGSTNLPTWLSLGTNTLGYKSLIFLDTSATNVNARFYRAFPASLIENESP